MNTGNPTSLFQQYLAVLTKGSCTVSENEIFDINLLPAKKAFLAPSIKGLEIKFVLLNYKTLILLSDM